MRAADGSIYYLCHICQDSGFVHPRKEDGRPDYGRVVPCRCRSKAEAEKAEKK